MAIKNFELRQIGVIYTPFNSPEGVPIQPLGAEGINGRVEVFPEFDIREVEKIGWLEKNIHKLPDARDDGRFIE